MECISTLRAIQHFLTGSQNRLLLDHRFCDALVASFSDPKTASLVASMRRQHRHIQKVYRFVSLSSSPLGYSSLLESSNALRNFLILVTLFMGTLCPDRDGVVVGPLPPALRQQLPSIGSGFLGIIIEDS